MNPIEPAVVQRTYLIELVLIPVVHRQRVVNRADGLAPGILPLSICFKENIRPLFGGNRGIHLGIDITPGHGFPGDLNLWIALLETINASFERADPGVSFIAGWGPDQQIYLAAGVPFIIHTIG